MSLYLCVFRGPDEVAGVEIGPYSDFGALRAYVAAELEGGAAGARFPVLMGHSDCEGEWSPAEAGRLVAELDAIRAEAAGAPVRPFPSEWQRRLAGALGLRPTCAAECFLDVAGRPLLLSLRALAAGAARAGLPITFQ